MAKMTYVFKYVAKDAICVRSLPRLLVGGPGLSVIPGAGEHAGKHAEKVAGCTWVVCSLGGRLV